MVPGFLLCAAVSLVAVGLHEFEVFATGRGWLEPLVLAILLGAAVRTIWNPGPMWQPGIRFTGKLLLEIAVVLLGASLSAQTVAAAGAPLVLGIFAVVAASVPISFAIGRLLGLRGPMAMLIACGNSICGNSAIAAVAPVIGADPEDVASSIAFTAVLGVGVVLTLPALAAALGYDAHRAGVMAGLTVYAVPQVLAAAAPMGALATQTGVLVKLVRVVALGPLVVVLSLLHSRRDGETNRLRPGWSKLVPWFVTGFILAAAARSFDLIPQAALPPIARTASLLTLLSMGALGLGVDVRAIARVGPRALLTVLGSLVVLVGLSVGLIQIIA